MTAVLIEDDINWRIKFQIILDEIGIKLLGTATNITEAKELLKQHNPCIIISDVILGEERVFEIFKENLNYYNKPIIFTTCSDKEIDYKYAQYHKEYLYLVKPIHKLTLKSAIENLCKKFSNQKQTKIIENLFIKGKYNQKVELDFDKILYIQQVKHYCTIFTEHQQFVQKKSLTNLMKELDERFIKVHRGFCVNKNYIDNFSVGLENLKIRNVDIPIGYTFKNVIKKLISEKYSVK